MLAVYGVYAVYGLCTGIACICVYGPVYTGYRPVYTGYRPVYAIPAIPYISLYRCIPVFRAIPWI